MQKQYLNASLVDLFSKFSAENSFKVSFATFCKYRPANCVAPKVNERDTCACIIHVNFDFIVKVLYEQKIIQENSTYKIMKSLLCEKRSDDCFTRKCDKCKTNEITFCDSNIDLNKELHYSKWVTKKKIRLTRR